MKNQAKIENFVYTQLDDDKNLKIMLVKVDKNLYIFYGKYVIRDESIMCSVEVDDKIYKFSNLKTATTWCVYKEKRMIQECKDIEYIDNKLSSISVELVQHNTLMKATSDKDLVHVYNNKVQEDYYLQQILLKKINNYINSSKRWQIKQFENAKTNNKR